MTFRHWLEWATPWAYGELGLMPWEFYRLTPREFLMKLEGFWRQLDREWEQIAALGLWVLSPHVGKNKVLTPEKLLGRKLKTLPDGE